MIDWMRKIIHKFNSILSFNFFKRTRAIFYFKSNNIRLGKNISFFGIGYSIKLGRDINIYNNCIFELGPASHLEIGNNVIFSYGCLISAKKSIKIGNNVQIGEYTSIRDTTHDYTDCSKPIMENKDISQSIVIGNNVWIGRNCLILPGSTIEEGVVVGANSLVKGTLRSNQIYGGNPIRELKRRPIKFDLI
jgi:acetyltransferase-like isoleucine patch superfamily enzyme